MTRTSNRWTLLLVVTTLASSPAQAHHSPSEVIVALSEKIDAGNQTASLFTRRGDEYRALNESEFAIADYRSALELAENYLPALYGLAHTYLKQQCYGDVALVARQGIAAAANPDEAGSFHAVLARIYEKQEQWQQAAQQWQHSLASSRPQVDWFLGEARALEKLARNEEAKTSLATAMTRNPSTVLHRAWLGALILCGDTDEAAVYIEAGLARARWKSSWLLLRARLRLAQEQPVAARQDAAAAIHEIDARLNPESPNPFLAADRAAALTIMSQTGERRAEPAKKQNT